ncbi:MAG: hypothetical protein QX192_10165 [Methylococcales bacterium]
MSNENNVIIDGVTGEVHDMGYVKNNKRYRCELDTVSDVKREMAKVYREARSGIIGTQDLTKLTWCLQAVAKVIETSDIEKRIEQLEQQAVKK